MNKFSKCIICCYAYEFDGVMSMLTGNTLHISFSCNNYDEIDNVEPFCISRCGIGIIMDILTGACWVDGGCVIPFKGCSNFKLSEIVNNEVNNYLDRK